MCLTFQVPTLLTCVRGYLCLLMSQTPIVFHMPKNLGTLNGTAVLYVFIAERVGTVMLHVQAHLTVLLVVAFILHVARHSWCL